MRAEDNRKSFLFGVPGIVLQIIGRLVFRDGSPVAANNPFAILLMLIGTVLLIVGLAYYAKGKGYHPAFGLFGLLSIIGLIVLAVLPDKEKAAPKR